MEYDDLSKFVSNPISRSPFHDAFGSGGEGQWKLYLRGSSALHSLLNKNHGSYLVISHGGLLNALMYCVIGLAPGAFGTGPRFLFQNAGFADLTYDPGRHQWTLETFNDVAHLATQESTSGEPS